MSTNALPSIYVVATAGHIEEHLAHALRDGASAALAPATLSFRDLVERLHAALSPNTRLSSPDVERMILAGAVRGILPEYRAAYTERQGTLDAFERTLRALRRHGVEAAMLREASGAEALEEGARTRLRMLAEVYDRQQQRLAAQGLVARDDLDRQLARALDATERSPESLGLPTVLRVGHQWALDPCRAEFLCALGRWLKRHDGGLAVHVACEPRRMKLPLSIDRALRVFEAEESAAIELEFGLRSPSAPVQEEVLSRWVTALSLGQRAADGRDRPSVRIAEAQGIDEEAQWVAGCVERWLAEGFGPHEIAVVVRRAEPETVQTLGRALDDARIPWSDRRGARLLSSPLARALLHLPRLVARQAEREDVLRMLGVLQGNAARGTDPEPWRIGATLRALGVESLFDTNLPKQLAEARKRGTSGAITYAIETLAQQLWTLAQDGTVEEHTERLSRWIDRVGADGRFAEEARTVMVTARNDPGAQAILRALARDEAGLLAAAELVRELPSVARAAGRDAKVSVGDFGEMVLDLARARELGGTGVHGSHMAHVGAGGVQVLEAEDAVGRSFCAVVIAGMHDGGFPARREEEALWGDVEREAVGKALGRAIERTGSRESETLLLLGVLASAERAVAASMSRHDPGGRVRAASPFIADMVRAGGISIERVGSDPLALSEKVPARGAERTLRLWAQREGTPPAEILGRLESVAQRAAVERSRQEFFAAPGVAGDRYNGRIDHDAALVAALDLADWAGPRRPLDVTTLERAARCGFKAFSLEVLKLGERQDPAETIDEKERGHLLHKLLEAGQEAVQETSDRDGTSRWQAIHAALDEAAVDFTLKESRVDPYLLEADLRAIRRQVELWLARRIGESSGWQMLETEVAFGPRKRWPAIEVPMPDAEPVVLKGRIDGVERLGDVLRVVEFKSGRGDGFRRRLQEGALDTQFQLVVYAAALERARQAKAVSGLKVPVSDAVDGIYVGFRDLSEHGLRESMVRSRKKPVVGDVDAMVREGAMGGGALGDAVRRVVEPLRRGVFDPRPRDCEFCQYRSVCRVETHDEPAGSDE